MCRKFLATPLRDVTRIHERFLKFLHVYTVQENRNKAITKCSVAPFTEVTN